MKYNLAIVTTHPIQYFAPMFKLLAEKCNLKVFYTWGIAGSGGKMDADFGKKIEWNIPLLDGYEYEFLENIAKEPGSHHFMGIQNPKIIDKVKSFNPSAILIYGWSYRSHLQVMRYFSGRIPIWFRGDSTLLNRTNGWRAFIRKIALSYVYKHIDKAFFVGKQNKKYFKEFGLKETQLIFAPHSVDNDRFAKDHSLEAHQLRQKFGIIKNEVLILFAGKLEWKKNPILLFDEFVKLNNPNIHLLFVGNGHLEDKLKGLKVDMKAENIHFLDFQNQREMPIVYQACDLFCLPSKSETWGLAVNEAMACGKAILVSEQVGCAIDLVGRENGLVFKNKKEFSEQLHYLTTDKKELIIMGISSKLTIADWTFQKQIDAILGQLDIIKK